MLDAPRQNWALYEAMSRRSDIAWMRGLTPEASFAIYADLFSLIWQARDDAAGRERLDQVRWKAKLAVQRRMSEAFAKLDERRRGRSAPPDAC
jgi:hypothetical protein